MTTPAFNMSDYQTPEFTRYRDAHKQLNGPGDQRPTAQQIIKDEGLEGKYTDKTILITGCSSGIGIETARALASTGARLFLTARNLDKGREALGSILQPGRVDLMLLDLNSLSSVRGFASEFLKASNGKLNILINNAGVMACPEGVTEDGFETQMGTNHIAHFLLFQLIKDALLNSSTPDFQSRVVVLSSLGHRYNAPKTENWMLTGGEYTPNAAYAHSKTANIWFSNEVERRYGSRGIHSLSMHPGGIATGLQVHVPKERMAEWAKDPKVGAYMKSVEQGAATTVWAAVAKCWEGKGGRYLDDCQICPPAESDDIFVPGYEKWAYDPVNEKKLWETSNEWVGIKE